MNLAVLQRYLPKSLRRHILHFDFEIERAVSALNQRLSPNSKILDAGAGETRHRNHFPGHRYFGVDLAVGDDVWDYTKLDALADLSQLPFRTGTFDAALNIVTLEHVRDPQLVVNELARSLKPGGRLLLIAPLEWEEHQTPHDYFRYTRYGLRHLCETAGLKIERIEPVGGYFRLLQRRLAGGLQFFPWPIGIVVGLIIAIPVLLLPWLDFLDREKRFTLGFIVEARA